MTTIYHGVPISPRPALRALGPRAFCVSYESRSARDAATVEAQATAIMYDNGEFAAYTAAKRTGVARTLDTDRTGLFAWLEARLFHPGRWAVCPDLIDAGPEAQDALLRQWPFGHRGAPVWHTDEPLDRLLRLADEWPRVCFGSAGAHWQIGAPAWLAAMDAAWDALERRQARPVVHMLRGTGVAHLYPFDSADSTGLAQSMHRYRMPLFAGTDDEFTGVIALADRLERRAAGL